MNFQFQTPPYVADYMVSLIDFEPKLVLEPSMGEGNLVKSLWKRFPKCKVIGLDIEETPLRDSRLDFYKQNFLSTVWNEKEDPIPDLILSNPPFTPMTLSYEFFEKLIKIQQRGIYILPYLFLINSDSRPKNYSLALNLETVINLPRRTFKGSRIQSCILNFKKGVTQETKYIWYDSKLNDK